MNNLVLKNYKVKFFGAKASRGEQVQQVKTEVKALNEEHVLTVLHKDYAVVQGLKVRELKEVSNESN